MIFARSLSCYITSMKAWWWDQIYGPKNRTSARLEMHLLLLFYCASWLATIECNETICELILARAWYRGTQPSPWSFEQFSLLHPSEPGSLMFRMQSHLYRKRLAIYTVHPFTWALLNGEKFRHAFALSRLCSAMASSVVWGNSLLKHTLMTSAQGGSL